MTSDLSRPLSTVSTNVSPATLVPHYDPDTHLLFLTGKVTPCTLTVHATFDLSPLTSDPQGDNTILAYEYVEDKKPYLFDVAPFACGSPHQVSLESRSNFVYFCSALLQKWMIGYNIVAFILNLYRHPALASLPTCIHVDACIYMAYILCRLCSVAFYAEKWKNLAATAFS